MEGITLEKPNEYVPTRAENISAATKVVCTKFDAEAARVFSEIADEMAYSDRM